MELAEVITNAGALAAVAYLALSWQRSDALQHREAQRADTIAHRETLAKLNQQTAETQRLTAEALNRLGDTLDTMTEKLTRLEERIKPPRRTTKKEI